MFQPLVCPRSNPTKAKPAKAKRKAAKPRRLTQSGISTGATPAQTKKISAMMKAVRSYVKRSGLASGRTLVEHDDTSRIGAIHVLFMTRKAKQKDFDGFIAVAKKHGYLVGGAGRTGKEQWFEPRPSMGSARVKKFKAADVREDAMKLLAELRKIPNSPKAGDGTVYLLIPGLKKVAVRRSWDGERVVKAERIARKYFPGARIDVDYGYVD